MAIEAILLGPQRSSRYTTPMLNRREFISATAGLAAATALDSFAQEKEPYILTVLGPIPAAAFGRALSHEHVICDFIGADKTTRDRWDVATVVKRMKPLLAQLKTRGFTGFVDCTPAYIGRDPRILKALAEETGIFIVTNTGYYGGAADKYVPKHAYEETHQQLAARWMRERERGIDGSNVYPGFIKIGVDEVSAETGQLSDIDAKIVRAAALTSRQSTLSVVCHTGGGPAGLAAAKLFIAEGGSPKRFIVAHADGHGLPMNLQAAELGVWVSFDAISRRPLEQHLKLVSGMIEKHANQLLLSHDNGWFNVGQENGGEIRDFNYIADTFIPALRKSGVAETMVNKLTISNPALAFALK